MDMEIQEGITLINRYGDHCNIQYMPKDLELGDVIIEFKEFLKACGYSDKQVDEYIEYS
jgi:hypothetical protein